MKGESFGAIILASGLSSRFENGNKLLSLLDKTPLAQHVAARVQQLDLRAVVAVVPADEPDLQSLFQSMAIMTVSNSEPARGQGHSIALGAAALADADLEGLFVLLADMPFVSTAHLFDMIDLLPGQEAVVSQVSDRAQPPVLFAKSVFEQLAPLTGDRGGRDLIAGLDAVASVNLSPDDALDIDTVEALQLASKRFT